MSWVTVAWSMTAATCVTMAAMHLLVWVSDRNSRASLLFSTCALSVAAIAGFELAMMRAENAREFGVRLQWMHVPLWVLVVALVGFVRQFLRAGKPWLAWAVCGARTLALLLNFLLPPNLNFREIELRRIPWWGGEVVSVPTGVTNPWTLVGQLSSLLLLAFLVDASVTAWRRGERRRAVFLGGSMIAGVLVAAGQSALTVWGGFPMPYILTLAFLGMLSVMGYELSRDLLRAARTSRELRESQDRMRLAASSADLTLWEWDIVRDEIWATEQGHAWLGPATAWPMNRHHYLQAIHPEDREAVAGALDKSVTGDGDYTSEHRVLTEDGRTQWFAARGRVEFAAGRRPVRMRGVSMDVTRRKEAEQQVELQREELAHLSRVAMLGELSGSLAHELNQPLTAILSNAQAAQRFLAADHPDPNELREILGDIVADDRRAGEVIHRLRQMFKKGKTQRQRLDLNDVVRAGLKLVQGDLLGRRVDLRAEFAQDLPAIAGDRIQLQQVLINLVANACNAMAETVPKERWIVVRTGFLASQGACVTVTDRGCGIPDGNLARIFEPFFTTRPEGLGLGLAVCRTIISAHRGRIWAENNPDRGASVRFTLPEAEEVRP